MKPHDKIRTGDVFPSLCPRASRVLCNERGSAAVPSWKCHVLFVTLLHKEVVFSEATEVDNQDGQWRNVAKGLVSLLQSSGKHLLSASNISHHLHMAPSNVMIM